MCGCGIMTLPVFSQVVVKTSGLTVKAGTVFYDQGLVLTPSSDLQFANDTITVSSTPVVDPSGDASIARVINISPAITFSGTAGLKYKASELNGNSENTLALAFTNGTTGNNFTTISSFDSTTGSYYVYSSGLSNITMGRVTANDNDITLPIVISNLTAKALANCAITLNWNSDKTDASNFNVERSADGRTWNQQGGAVTMAGRDFSWIDAKPLSGVNIYRLIMQSTGEQPVYSSSVQANSNCDAEATVSVYPNPASDHLTAKISGTIAGTARLTVYDFNGKVLETIDVKQTEVNIPLTKIASGSYILQYKDDRKTQNIKFGKQM
jgi:hypothetical protein